MAATAAIATIALIVHILAAVVWVGGMFFAYLVLRPATAALDPAPRLVLWSHVLQRFFAWVFAAIVLLLASGFWMVFGLYGGFAGIDLYINLMMGLGILMMLLFLHLYFAPWRRFRGVVRRQDWLGGARLLAQIRVIVLTNLVLGLVVVAIGGSGRYWP
ncbi:MAG: CopD family protein [Stellaceae bacterium]